MVGPIGNAPLLFRGRCLDRAGLETSRQRQKQTFSLDDAAARYGVRVVRLRRWCATGKLRCERDGEGWRIPVAEAETVTQLGREYATDRGHVRALAVPVPEAPADLAARVAARLGLTAGAVTVTPLALDGADYVVAVWRGDLQDVGGAPGA